MTAYADNLPGANICEPTILIIDDDPNNLAIVTGYLEDADFTILVAEDGESGVERADFARPELILLDVMMPGIDGFETCRRLKARSGTRDIPVIFMTALSEMEHKVRGFEAGAVDYIAKPLQREEIIARVGVHLRMRELTSRLQESNEFLEMRVMERTLALARTNSELQTEIGQRRKAEDEQRKLNRTLRMLSECNQTLIRATDETVLLKDVCRVIAEFGNYRMVWVGYAEQDERRSIRPIAYAGHEDDFLSTIRITWADEEYGQGPSGRAIRTGEPAFAENILTDSRCLPWRDELVKRQFLSSAAIPLITGGTVLGTLTLYADKPIAFDSEEVKLLMELADDLAYGIVSLRTREEHRRAEEEIRTLNEELEERVALRTAELEQLNSQLESFSYSVSHDLRAPLRAIAGFSRIIMDEYLDQLPDGVRSYLERICVNGQRMGNLIEDLLTFARLGRQPITKTKVNSRALVQDLLSEELHDENEGRTVEMTIGDLPPCDADPQLIRQVFLNLLANAYKYTRKRDVARIEVGAFPRDGKNVYYVRDNGAGFDMRYSEKLFGVFQRLHDKKEFEGTGVGLAIVHNIVNRHGGNIWAEAYLDKGATFFFTL